MCATTGCDIQVKHPAVIKSNATASLALVMKYSSCSQVTQSESFHTPNVAKVQKVMACPGLIGDRISLQLAGCHSLFGGGDFKGTRLLFSQVDEALEPLIAAFALRRLPHEGFGACYYRQGGEVIRALREPITA